MGTYPITRWPLATGSDEEEDFYRTQILLTRTTGTRIALASGGVIWVSYDENRIYNSTRELKRAIAASKLRHPYHKPAAFRLSPSGPWHSLNTHSL